MKNNNMSDICSICLENFEEDHIIKTLSCNHKLHYRCYISIVFRENIFIQCPICRTRNTNVEKPKVSPKRNIELLCSQGVGKINCSCKTKKGHECKNKSRLLNYGMCHNHNTNILKKDKYPLMESYMYLILSQRNSWNAKIQLFDIGKKLIIKFNMNSLEDIMMRFYEYFSISDTRIIKDYNELYDYFDIEKPNENWLNYCKDRHKFI